MSVKNKKIIFKVKKMVLVGYARRTALTALLRPKAITGKTFSTMVSCVKNGFQRSKKIKTLHSYFDIHLETTIRTNLQRFPFN